MTALLGNLVSAGNSYLAGQMVGNWFVLTLLFEVIRLIFKGLIYCAKPDGK